MESHDKSKRNHTFWLEVHFRIGSEEDWQRQGDSHPTGKIKHRPLPLTKEKSLVADKQDHKQTEEKQTVISPSQFCCHKDTTGLLANSMDGKAYQGPTGDLERGGEAGGSGQGDSGTLT